MTAPLRRPWPLTVLGPMLLAAAVRLPVWLAAGDAYLPHAAQDEGYYEQGVAWLETGRLSNGLSDTRSRAWRGPLYPAFLAAVEHPFPAPSPGRVILLQVLLAVAAAPAVFWLGARLAGRWGGIAAAVLYALDADAAWSLASLNIHAFYGLVLLATAAAAAWWADEPDRRAPAFGAALAVSLLCRSVHFAAAPLAMLAAGLSGGSARMARRALLIAAGACAALLPWTARNWAVSGRFYPFDAHSGAVNLYMASRGQIHSATVESAFSAAESERPGLRGLLDRDRDAAFGELLRLARARVRADPAAYARSTLERAAWLFAPLWPWAFPALWLAWERRRDPGARAALSVPLSLGAYALVCVQEPYLDAARPLLAVLGGAGTASAASALAGRAAAPLEPSARALAGRGAAALAAFFAALWTAAGALVAREALGSGAGGAPEGPRAARLAAERLAKAPTGALPSDYAGYLTARGRHAEACRIYERILAGSSSRPGLLEAYADCLERTGRVEEALRAADALAALEAGAPDRARVLLRRARLAASLGRTDAEARDLAEAERAAAFDPDAGEALIARLIARGETARARRAGEALVAASRGARSRSRALAARARAELASGLWEEAARGLAEALSLDPHRGEAWDHLAEAAVGAAVEGRRLPLPDPARAPAVLRARAMTAVARAAQAVGDDAAALAHLSKAARAAPLDPARADALTAARAALGRGNALEAARSPAGGEFSSAAREGAALLSSGRLPEARAALARACGEGGPESTARLVKAIASASPSVALRLAEEGARACPEASAAGRSRLLAARALQRARAGALDEAEADWRAASPLSESDSDEAAQALSLAARRVEPADAGRAAQQLESAASGWLASSASGRASALAEAAFARAAQGRGAQAEADFARALRADSARACATLRAPRSARTPSAWLARCASPEPPSMPRASAGLTPAEAERLTARGQSLLAQGRTAEALEAFRAVRRGFRGRTAADEGLSAALATLAASAGRLTAEEWAEADELSAHAPAALEAAVQAAVARGDREEPERMLRSLGAGGASSSWAAASRALEARGLSAPALLAAATALSRAASPGERAAAREALALAHARGGRVDEAREELARAERESPGRLETARARALALGGTAHARKWLDAARGAEPGTRASAWVALARALAAEGDARGARAAHERAEGVRSGYHAAHAEAALHWARLTRAASKEESSRLLSDLATRAKAPAARAAFEASRAAYDWLDGRERDGDAAMERALLADPAAACRGDLALERSRAPARLFERCLRVFPGDAGLLADRGVARWLAGERDAAVADFRAALRAEPARLSAALSLAAALEAAGRGREGAEVLRSALKAAGPGAEAALRRAADAEARRLSSSAR